MRLPASYLFTIVATLGLLYSAPASGQTDRNASGSSGLTSGLGFSGGGGFGSSGAGSLGGGGLGSSGLGGGTGGGLGNTGGFGQGVSGIGTQTGFGQSTSGFIGRDSAEVTAMFDNMTRQGNAENNGGSRNGGRNSRNDQTQKTQQRVRVKLKATFNYPNPLSAELVAQRDAQLVRLLAARNMQDVSVVRDGSNVMLSGSVASTWEQKVAMQLAAQQPGVSNVTNQMTVAEVISAPTAQE